MKEVKNLGLWFVLTLHLIKGFDCGAFMGSFYRITDVITFDVIRFYYLG